MQTTDTSPDALARFGHALSDPLRARILMSLAHATTYPSELADDLGVSRQSMSNHLACLRGCGLVVATPQGRRMRYELADRRLATVLTQLHDVVIVSAPEECPGADTGNCC